MYKDVIKILQGIAVTQTTLGGLTIYPRVANFVQCIYAKNYENWLSVDCKNKQAYFFDPPCTAIIIVQRCTVVLYDFNSVNCGDLLFTKAGCRRVGGGSLYTLQNELKLLAMAYKCWEW